MTNDAASSRDSSPETLALGSRLGLYVLESKLGAGRLGPLYLGRSPGGAEVAIRIIRPELAGDREFLHRLRQLTAAARSVPRQRTAALVDADLDHATPYLVSEYVDGMTLSEAVDTDGPPEWNRLLALATDVAEALAALHERGLVHGNLTPSNVLLSPQGTRVTDCLVTLALWADDVPGFPTHTFSDDIHAWGDLIAFAGGGGGTSDPTGNLASIIERALSGGLFQPQAMDLVRLLRDLTVSTQQAELPTQTGADTPPTDQRRWPITSTDTRNTPSSPWSHPDSPALGSLDQTAVSERHPGASSLLPTQRGRRAPAAVPRPSRGTVFRSPFPWPLPRRWPLPRTWPRRKAVTGMAVVAALVALAIVLSLVLPGRGAPPSPAERSAASRSLAGQAAAARSAAPTFARQLSLAAFRVSPTPEAARQLLTSFGPSLLATWPGTSPADSVAFLPRTRGPAAGVGSLLAIGNDDRTDTLLNISNPAKPQWAATINPDADNPGALAVNDQGTLLASPDASGNTALYDVRSPRNPTTLAEPSFVISLAFSSDGTRLATMDTDRTVYVWNVRNPASASSQQFSDTRSESDGGVLRQVVFNPDGTILAAASRNGDVRLLSVSDYGDMTELSTITGAPEDSAGTTTIIHGVAFAPSGHLLAVASQGHQARIFDVSNPAGPRQLASTPRLRAPVDSLAFSRDRSILAVGTDDGLIHLFDISDPSRPSLVFTITDATARVLDLAFSPDGSLLAAASADTSTRLWDVNPAHIAAHACADPGNGISSAEWKEHVAGKIHPLRCP